MNKALQWSLTSTATSKVKKALGMKSGSMKNRSSSGGSDAMSEGRVKRMVMIRELVRVHMRVSE